MYTTFFLIFVKKFDALDPLSSTKCVKGKEIKLVKCNWTQG